MPKRITTEVGGCYYFAGPVGPFEKKRYADASSRLRIADHDFERIVHRVIRVAEPSADTADLLMSAGLYYQIVESYPFAYINYRD
jgi:hypothetical protein